MKCAECQATSIVGLFATISNTRLDYYLMQDLRRAAEGPE